VLDLDVAYRPLGRAHLGVVRSPLRDRSSFRALLERAVRAPRLRVVGLMGYEAHVAGLPDTPANVAFKALAWPAVVERRREAVALLRAAGVVPEVVNGGGTGSLGRTLSDPSVTEATVGSGFLQSHLFDAIGDLALEPAVFVALEVVRIPDATHVTASGGGYAASGTAGHDRLLQPYLPRGMSLLDREGGGEVQTPLDVSKAERAPRAGDPVIFRPAKAGEIAERFREHVWISGGTIVGRSPTYRGEGWTFF
jgi:D-serine deaminase-like pyridoxal phosphate-dependent protein